MNEEELKELIWNEIQAFLHKNVSLRSEEARDEVESIMYGVEFEIVKAIKEKGLI